MSEINETKRLLTKKDLNRFFWQSQGFVSGFNYTKEEAPGFVFSMMPVIEKVYTNEEDKKKAYQRHTELFLTEARVSHLVLGITAAMEEQNALKKDEFDENSINAVKSALMGPLAGIGDSLYHGTLRPLAAGLAVSMIAASGYTSPLGSILFVLIMAGIGQTIRYLGIHKGYEKGFALVDMIQNSGLLQKITRYAGIVASIVIGGWVSAFVWVSTPLSFTSGETTIALQSILDGLMPNLLPLITTLLCYWLLKKKKISPVWLIVGVMIVGVILYALGIIV